MKIPTKTLLLAVTFGISVIGSVNLNAQRLTQRAQKNPRRGLTLRKNQRVTPRSGYIYFMEQRRQAKSLDLPKNLSTRQAAGILAQLAVDGHPHKTIIHGLELIALPNERTEQILARHNSKKPSEKTNTASIKKRDPATMNIAGVESQATKEKNDASKWDSSGRYWYDGT